MKLLLENIKELVQVEEEPQLFRAGVEMQNLKNIKNAFLIISDELIKEFGPMEHLKDTYRDDDLLIEIDCSRRLVYPSYCDPHTHLVFSGSQENEFVERIKGKSSEEGSFRSNSILNAARLVHETHEETLYAEAMERIVEILKTGTGAVEIKTGYGLNLQDELKMLKVIKRIKKTAPLCVRSTFMAANTIPEKYKENRKNYIDLIIHEMIPRIASEELADYIDVFCDRGFLSMEDAGRVLTAGLKNGLKPKIHANELGLTGGVRVGVNNKALSADHLEYMDQEDMDYLRGSDTMPTVLPGVSFFTNGKWSPVREMINAGLPVALASGYNPCNAPSGNMNFIASLGCLQYQMLPEEVINATTLNSAYAMGVADRLGTICRGKTANLFITSDISGINYIPYRYASDLIETVILNGEIQSL